MGECTLCKDKSPVISQTLGVCLPCIRQRPDAALAHALSVHQQSRAFFGLPVTPPRAPHGISCKICVNECSIPDNSTGYCGLRRNAGGKIRDVSAQQGKLSWYHDPLPTNCVGDWVCAGGTGAGFPQYAHRPGPEYGFRNLAVFFHACSFNCLFCQNWHFRKQSLTPHTQPVEDLVAAVDNTTSCICYFGGDPAPQLPFSLKAAELARTNKKGEILRICWETNGSMHVSLLDNMIDVALSSGGCIKFDLKAWDETLHKVLTGITNHRTLENFVRAGKRFTQRTSPPLLLASTLLVPGYIDEKEVGQIARLIASIDPDLPYSLLAFHPDFQMADLPLTSKKLAEQCRSVAMAEGLTNVLLGNIHLLV
jgi:pyruvate formate lyase activating enzyme